MTPVTQTKLVGRDGYGTCYSAVLASLLDLPERAVPHFANPDAFTSDSADDLSAYALGLAPLNWYWASRGWLRMLGFVLVDVDPTDISRPVSDPFLIASGVSPRSPEADGKEITHAVIYARQADGSYALAHDPYPDGGGIVGDVRAFSAVRPLAGEDDE